MKKVRYSLEAILTPIGILVLPLGLAIYDKEDLLGYEIYGGLGVFLAIISALFWTKNSIKYDKNTLYFYKFYRLRNTIDIIDIKIIESSHTYNGHAKRFDYLKISTDTDKKPYKFGITGLNKDDIEELKKCIVSSNSNIKFA